MATFITIGYGDETGYQRTPPDLRDAAHAHDDRLVEGGAVMGIAGTPVQVRNPEGTGIITTTGAFARADLPVAGFAVIEADTLEEAVALVAGSPCSITHGVVEVWPLAR
jgi:hypothetical protein